MAVFYAVYFVQGAASSAVSVNAANMPAATTGSTSTFSNLAQVSMAAAAGSQSENTPSFYDVLRADRTHRLIVQAIDSDTAGKTKALLEMKAPVTVFVPTDSVSRV
jgi:uncharacterized surface protein with fasciclin (FAS1) repeats